MSEKRKLTEAVTVRIEPKIYKILNDRAELRDITVNSLVRELIDQSIDEIDLQTIIVKKQTKTKKIST